MYLQFCEFFLWVWATEENSLTVFLKRVKIFEEKLNIVVTPARYKVGQSFFFSLFLFSQKLGYLFKKELHIERKSANRFIFVSLKLNCHFYWPGSGVDRYFSRNCEVRF